MIFASPLQRAHETAKIINENHQLEIKIDSRVQEINFGQFEGVINNKEFQYYKQNRTSLSSRRIIISSSSSCV